MKELENLLNKLIEEWRKPFWITLKTKIKIHEWVWFYDDKTIQLEFDCGNMGKYVRLRQIVSAESWLWQFVCKNKLHKKADNFWENVSKASTNIWWFPHNHQYRLLESARIPEKELAKFLVENIVIEWNSK